MITSLALMACLELGTGLNPAGLRQMSGRSICLTPLTKWALWRLGYQLAAWQRTGSYLRILGSYARYATPGRTRDRPTVPNISCDPPGSKPQNRNGRELSPAITLRYF
jgi:hypothetical protein